VAVAGSRTTTPTNVVDDGFADDGGVSGLAVVNPEAVTLPPFQPTQQSTEGSLWPVPHYNLTHQQLSFMPETLMQSQQGVFQQLVPMLPVLGQQQHPLIQNPAQPPVQQSMSSQQPAKKKAKRSSECLSNEKDKEPL
jgi:hypothetical protein